MFTHEQRDSSPRLNALSSPPASKMKGGRTGTDRSFKELVGKHIAKDLVFSQVLARELVILGDVETGKMILRD